MDAKDLLLNTLNEREANYREKLKLCRADVSRGAIHDLRTSIRRLLAMLDIVAFLTSTSKIEKLSDRLEEQLNEVGNLRDLQVMFQAVSENVDAVPELEPFQDYLERRKKKKQRASEKYIEDIKLGNTQKKLLKIREAVEKLSPDELNGKLPQVVDEAYLTVAQRYGEIDAAQLASIHHLRVAFKKFRYRVEVIHPCLPDFPGGLLERMGEYQTWMGDIHDAEVLLVSLSEFAEKDASYDPQPARRFYERILADDLSAYLEHKEKVTTFWRATPLAAFPWKVEMRKEE